MSHKSVEIVIGRLTTDEELRRRFSSDPTSTLQHLKNTGLDLTAAEVDALLRTPVALWAFVSTCVHPRLQKVALKGAEP